MILGFYLIVSKPGVSVQCLLNVEDFSASRTALTKSPSVVFQSFELLLSIQHGLPAFAA